MRKRIHEILGASSGHDALSSVYDVFMILVIIVSLLPLNFKGEWRVFELTDDITAAIFILDYLLRWMSADFDSREKPAVAFLHYPFTTMEPSLGIVGYHDNKSFVMADIPGIIEGAAEGKGLGLRFLRHIERNSLLLFMVPGDTDDIKREYEILLDELRRFNPDMLDKHRVLAITKCDLLDAELVEMLRETLPDDLPCVFISAVANQGLNELKDVLWRELNADSNKLAAVMAEDTLVHRDKDMTRFQEELADEGEDEDIEYIDDIEDVDDFEDLEDYEYEEDEP